MARTLVLGFNSGLSPLTLELTRKTVDALVGTVTATEWTAGKTTYEGSMADLPSFPADEYFIAIKKGTAYVGRDEVKIGEANGRYYASSVVRVEGSGRGARLVTITVTDLLAAPLEGVSVRVSQGAESYVQPTNASGVAQFNLDDATWTVTLTKALYSIVPQTLIVDGVETVTYQMSPTVALIPSAPNLTVGSLLCLNPEGIPETGVVITFRAIKAPAVVGYALDEEPWAKTSNGSGIVTSEFVIGGTYKYRRGTHGKETEFLVPNSVSFSIPQGLGRP